MDLPSHVAAIEKLLAEGRVVEALQQATDIFALPPDRLADEGRTLARLAERLGVVAVALREWQRIAEEHPRDQEALARLTALHAARGAVDEALTALDARAQAGETAEDLLRERVALLVDAGRQADAERILEERRRQSEADDPLIDELQDIIDGSVARTDDDGLFDDAKPADGTLNPSGERTADPASPPRPRPVESDAPLLPSDADVLRFLQRFAGREDVHARMWADEDGNTGYTPVREPMTFQHVRNHLLGNVTLGVYPIRLDGRVGFLALDLDIAKPALEAARYDPSRAVALREAVRSHGLLMLAKARELGFDPLLEASGFKGRHLWIFFEEPQPAAAAHALGLGFVRLLDLGHPDLSLEVFPKQPRLARGQLGNLIKLPLGIHRRTGRYALLLDDEGRPAAEPHALLRAKTRAPAELVTSVLEAMKGQHRAGSTGSSGRAKPPKEPSASDAASTPLGFDAGPAPPPPGPEWTAEDFDRDPEVAALLSSCHVLGALRQRIESHRRVTADEIAVLRHSLGHLAGGVLAVNYLLRMCAGVPGDALLKKRLSGSPISCAKIHQRVPHIAGTVACECHFEDLGGAYPNPLLHVRDLARSAHKEEPEPPLTVRSPEELARVLGGLKRRAAEIEAEIREVSRILLAGMAGSGSTALELEEGTFVRRVDEGVESLEWQPADGRAVPAGSGDAPDRSAARPADGQTP